jgi:hypothetical protein
MFLTPSCHSPKINDNIAAYSTDSLLHLKYIDPQNLTDMLTDIHPKLPMRDKAITRDYYINKLGFQEFGSADYDGYLMVEKDSIQIHFFEFKTIDPKENYGQVYIRTDNIEEWYRLALEKQLAMPALGVLQIKHWGQKEFSLLDPDNNLLTFGQSL